MGYHCRKPACLALGGGEGVPDKNPLPLSHCELGFTSLTRI